ncbi:MAG: DegT/DnrJ/EryC1/StrS family aminotransferase [Candidatus Acidiferrales bacterium]
MRIPLSSPDINEQDIEAVTAVLRTPQLSLGPKLAEFERSITRYLGASDAVGVSSGTSALHLCIRALGISDGDEVIVPSFAFIAVANAVRYERAVPVFVDVDAATLNLDPERVEAAITHRTKAIIIVHTFGVPAEIDRILEISKRHGVSLIEDACEAIGAEYRGQKVGTFGDVATLAFYPNKQITTGEGGAVVTNNSNIASKVRSLRNQGTGAPGAWLAHTEVGYNYRISEINCALGISQLSRLDSILERREAIARRYDSALASISELRRPSIVVPNRKISWFVYVVRLRDTFDGDHRDWIYDEMKAMGIGVGRYFAPVHLQPAYSAASKYKSMLAVTEFEAERTLALPFFNQIRDEQVDEVCENLCRLCGSPNFSKPAS